MVCLRGQRVQHRILLPGLWLVFPAGLPYDRSWHWVGDMSRAGPGFDPQESMSFNGANQLDVCKAKNLDLVNGRGSHL